MDWLIEHWADVVFIATTAVTLASAIAALTPTPKDDAIIAKIYRLIEVIALNVGKAKQTGAPDTGSGSGPQSTSRLQASVLATLAAVALALLVAGCASNPHVRWAQAQTNYNKAVDALKRYRAPCVDTETYPNAGPDHPLCLVDDDLARKIEPVRERADSLLEKMLDAADAGQSLQADAYLTEFQTALDQLIAYQLEAEGSR